MPRPIKWPPTIRRVGGKDVVKVTVAGQRTQVTLGPTGSPEARAEYLRILAEAEAVGLAATASGRRIALVGEVLADYLDRARTEVEKRQYERVRAAMKPAARLYGHTPAAQFGPVALRAVRDQYIRSGYCRRLCNQMTSLVRQAFRLAVEREQVPVEVHLRLKTLGPLLAGKTTAPDHPRVLPVDRAIVDATLPHLPPIVADMVRVQLLTGCRPGEVCLLRGADVTRPWQTFDGVAVWLFRLSKHKTAWKGGERNVPLGPRAQAILLPYLDSRDANAYCFSPAESRRQWEAAKRAARKTPVQPSQVRRAEELAARRLREPPEKQAGSRYTTGSYGAAIARACEAAGIEPWAPNRLRHEAGTRVGADHGREDAQALLGHSTPTTTAIYAELSERAGRVAAKDG